MSTCINFEIFATRLYFWETSEQGKCSHCIQKSLKLHKSGFTVKTFRNLCFIQCARKLVRYLCVRINRQIPRCVLTWVLLIVAFCYDLVYELCGGLSDLPQFLLEFYIPMGVFYFLTSALCFSFLSSLSRLDLFWLCLGF